MDKGSSSPETDATATYEALNAWYRMMDEYLRQSQRIAEQLWMPWVRPFLGTASPFIPPEPWMRAYGDLAMAWMSMAQPWTAGSGRWNNMGPRGGPDWPPRADKAEGSADGHKATR